MTAFRLGPLQVLASYVHRESSIGRHEMTHLKEKYEHPSKLFKIAAEVSDSTDIFLKIKFDSIVFSSM